MIMAPAGRAVGDNRPYQAGTVGKYGVGKGVMKIFFKKSVDEFCGIDIFFLPLISVSKFYSDLWGILQFFDNGVFFCLVTDKGIQSTAVLF